MSTKSKTGLSFDPRGKILLLLLTVLIAVQAPTISFVYGLMLIIFLFAIVCRKERMAVINLLIFSIFCAIRVLAMDMKQGSLQTMIYAWMGLMFQVYPCGFMAGVILSTTKINEFLTAMNRARISKKVTIPMAVMLRYLPVIREDWHFIRDAMAQRGLSPSLWGFITKPSLTLECVYTPMLIAASRAADDLTVAAVTRGVESPKRRSCLVNVGLRWQDYGAISIFAGYYLTMKLAGAA